MKTFGILFLSLLIAYSCVTKEQKQDIEEKTGQEEATNEKIPILIDTDANNELDDQHALAYAFFNGDVFDVVGVTVNNTRNGNGIQGHYDEAQRVMKLCDLDKRIPLLKGAEGIYADIVKDIGQADFDGHEAVNFIIEQAKAMKDDTLVLVPVGKLTNIALALKKAPEIIPHVKVVWLGANYPEPGEYNLENDTTSVNPVIESGVHFEMVTVRYGKPSGTDFVKTTPQEINQMMPGLGPQIEIPVTGRHGGTFSTFGDYSISLFEHIDLHGDPPSRSLFDMAAIAIIKNPSWAEQKTIPAPRLAGRKWVDRPDNKNTIIIWENFDRDMIMNDFFETMENYSLVE